VGICGIDDSELVTRFNDFYVGSYRDEQDWAESIALDLDWADHLDDVVEPSLRPFVRIDYEKIVRHARTGWDAATGPDGRLHVFLR
jgi:hypothetical protein